MLKGADINVGQAVKQRNCEHMQKQERTNKLLIIEYDVVIVISCELFVFSMHFLFLIVK